MNIQLTIDANSTDHLMAELRRLLQGEARKPADAIADTPVDGEVLDPPKPTRAPRKPKETVIDAKVEPEKPVEKTEAPATIDDLRAALVKLAKADGHGEDAVWKMLGELGAKKASEVPEAKRADVIAEINKLLGV